ncbi:hypothetical protein GCM10023350_53800 [Nocardioides endophyticus]|uniref:Condensation domain-containing protein n=1 Tax=Nocardioides endophyticus TaxID=1353775 RepID=A0ABP8ZNI4_9ACTN
MSGRRACGSRGSPSPATGELRSVPDPQLHALEVAFYRADAGEPPLTGHLVSLALLSAVRGGHRVPLSPSRQLLASRLGLRLPHHLLGRVYDTTLGDTVTDVQSVTSTVRQRFADGAGLADLFLTFYGRRSPRPVASTTRGPGWSSTGVPDRHRDPSLTRRTGGISPPPPYPVACCAHATGYGGGVGPGPTRHGVRRLADDR